MEWHFKNRRQNGFSYTKETIHFPLQEVWSLTLSEAIPDTPIYAESAIFVSALDQFYKLDSATGKIHWSIKPDTAIRPSPSYYNGKIYFSSSIWGILHCVDSVSGKEITRLDTGISAGSCRIVDDKIYLICGKGKDKKQVQGFACYSLENMSEIWFHASEVGVSTETCAIENGILVYGDVAGIVYGLNSLTGTEIWRLNIQDWIPPRKEQFDKIAISHAIGTPIIVGNVVIIIAETPGQTFALDLKTGQVLWLYKTEERLWNYHGMGIGDKNWHCLTMFRKDPIQYISVEIKTGKVVLKKDISIYKEALGIMNVFSRTGLVISDYHFIGIYDPARVAAFNKNTGELVWSHSTDRSKLRGDGRGIYADGKLIWVRNTGDIYCFE